MALYRRLLAYARPYRWALVLALLFSAGVSLFTALTAWIVNDVLTQIFWKKDENALAVLPFVVMGIFLAKGLCRYGHAWFMQYVANSVVQDIRNALYSHIVHLPYGFHAQNATGNLLARIIADCALMQRACTGVVKDLFQNSITVIGLAVVVFMRNWQLAPIALVVLPIAVAPMVRLGRRLRKLSRIGQKEVSELTVQIEESLTGIKEVKSFANEAHEEGRFRHRARRHFDAMMRAVKLSELASPLMEGVSALGLAGIIWLGGRQVIEGRTEPGEFISFLAAIGMMYTPLKSLGRVNNVLQQALGASDRVFEILDEKTEAARDLGEAECDGVRERVLFRDVCFRYPARNESVVEGIDLEIARGEIVALVGRSGSGKSTLANLLLRLHDPDRGQIEIDGRDLRSFRLASLRRAVGLVSQEVILFEGSVRENLLYGRADASEEEMVSAAKAAFAHEFVMEMPEGYETLVGEKGVRLSGGQRQRLAIARTLLADPPILVLDEATSALDSESEARVQTALNRLMQGRTTLLIAHRFSTLEAADRIVVLDRGRVAEMGTRTELEARNGLYRQLAQIDRERGLRAESRPDAG
jgi:subfamily B ATP-binding cassette protein MsbA